VQNKKIVLVDDVTTSGTTFTEAARVLKLAGAKKILALAVAKA
jgi:predicted amidophosphoribosyltransferase